MLISEFEALERDQDILATDDSNWQESSSNSGSSTGAPNDDSSPQPLQTKTSALKTIKLHGPSMRQSRTLTPNLTRRSHKKSRAGCFTCKGRKIKCGEQKPRCGNCVLKGLTCVYPESEQPRRREAPLPLARRPISSASPGLATFTLSDMRFFHHYLTTAFPHLPVGNDHVWVNEIPQFAEQHEYLMHALLSLGASHLGRLTGSDYRKESLTHRGQAIAGLNQALSQPAKAFGEADAMIAACYALTFQASYMGDGLADFITMVRGCALTTAKIRQEKVPTAFNLQPNWHFKIMAPKLSNLPRVNPLLLEHGFEALQQIKPLLVTETDTNFHQALTDVITSLSDSSSSGYLKFIGVYAIWYELCHDSFKDFLDPNNMVAQLLLAYFIGIQMLMVPLSVYEWADRADVSKVKVLYGMVEWADTLFIRLENSTLREHLTWPKHIIATVVTELGGVPLDGPSVLQLSLPIKKEETPLSSPPPYSYWDEVTKHMDFSMEAIEV